PTDQPVFVYCKSGYRAAISTAALQTMGLTNVRAFPPGFAGWSNAGQPIAAAQ
ncbi:MAG: rhodanese-like domain-containing protein, partial [Anaerolineae bacterium]|nr:rhodanese-like domain-containing protein [Anaerolineae bacterium]